MTLWKTARKDSRGMCTYCTRNGSCVDSEVGIGSWSMRIPIQRLTVAGWTQKAAQILPYDFTWRLPAAISLGLLKYKDYAWQASLCWDLAYTVSQSSCFRLDKWRQLSNLKQLWYQLFSAIVTWSYLLQTVDWRTLFSYMPQLVHDP